MQIAGKRLGKPWVAAWPALSLAVAGACEPQIDGIEETRAIAGDRDAAVTAVSALVDKYTQSVNEASTELASEVWLTSDQVSFINPQLHEVGWEAIARNIYEEAMGGMFSERKLVPEDVDVKIFGDTAVARFSWVFDATRREDGSKIQTTGWETQVYARVDDLRWRLVHVHYSE